MINTTKQKSIVIIGGGASGIFAAIRCAEVSKEKNINVRANLILAKLQ